MRYTVDPKAFNAVQACCGVDDVRDYLNCFFVDSDNSCIVGTNGHVMAIAPITRDPNCADIAGPAVGDKGLHGWLFKAMLKPLPVTVETLVIDTRAERLDLDGWKLKGPRRIALEPYDGTSSFPDYDWVKVTGLGEPHETKGSKPSEVGPAHLGLNLDLIGKAAKWARVNPPHVVFSFTSAHNTVPFRALLGLEGKRVDVELTVMPLRLS